MQTKSKIGIRRRICVIILAELLLGMGLVGYLMPKEPVASVPRTSTTPAMPPALAKTIPHSTDVGLPVRLKIPIINVDAAIDQVGLTAHGELGAPKKLANAAWYVQGPRPGGIGSAVIDGHFSDNKKRRAVFDYLHTLQQGDTVFVEDEKGRSIPFVVRELRTYDPSEDTSTVFASNDGRAHLNLITCQGPWNNTQKSFSARLVVFTDRVATD